MSNPFSSIISPALKLLYTNMIDALLEDSALTLPCRFVYSGTKWTKCPNCNFNSQTNKSNNVYLVGGPIPFTKGICPYCSGEGKIPVEDTTETHNLAVIWDYKKFIPIAEPIKVTEGSIQTICSMSLIAKFKKVKELIVDTNIEKYVRHRFMRDSEPNPAGFGSDDYIITLWRRT